MLAPIQLVQPASQEWLLRHQLEMDHRNRKGQGRSCVFCLVNAPTHVLVPCGHKVCCDDCTKFVADGSKGTESCPVCKTRVRSTCKVYD